MCKYSLDAVVIFPLGYQLIHVRKITYSLDAPLTVEEETHDMKKKYYRAKVWYVHTEPQFNDSSFVFMKSSLNDRFDH